MIDSGYFIVVYDKMVARKEFYSWAFTGVTVRNKGYIVLTYKYQKEGKRWTAYCEELSTAVFGRSLVEAERRLEEAVWLHLNTLEDVGERERFFAEHNIQVHSAKPKNDITVCMPLNQNIFVHPRVQRIPALSSA